jgi:hypothetical protein
MKGVLKDIKAPVRLQQWHCVCVCVCSRSELFLVKETNPQVPLSTGRRLWPLDVGNHYFPSSPGSTFSTEQELINFGKSKLGMQAGVESHISFPALERLSKSPQ